MLALEATFTLEPADSLPRPACQARRRP